MSNARATTLLAIVAGTGVGAFLALWGGSAPTPEPAKRGSSPDLERQARATTAAAAPAPEAARAPVAAPSTGSTSDAATESAELTLPAELSTVPVSELESRCARTREAKACLAAARAYEKGRNVSVDASKARTLVAMAIALLDTACLERDPESCALLAELYRRGAGVEQNTATAVLLEKRSLALCAGRGSPFCTRQAAAPVR